MLIHGVIGMDNRCMGFRRNPVDERIGEKLALGVDNVRTPVDQFLNKGVELVESSSYIGINLEGDRTYVVDISFNITFFGGRETEQLYIFTSFF